MTNNIKNIILAAAACCLSLACGCGERQYSGYHKITLVTASITQPATHSEKNYGTESVVAPTAVSEQSKELTVYYTKTGKKYHFQNPCGSGEYFECTLEEAKEKGLEPCGKCAK